MSNKSEKPYVLRAAEFVYSNIIEIKKQNPEINNIQAFEIFMTTKDYDILSSGEFHDKWFLELKNNKFVDQITKKEINQETLRLLELQKNSFDEDLRQLVETRIKMTRQKLDNQNLQKLLKKRIEVTRSILYINNITQ